ncbi:hypothetical protein PHLGIDRAFT_126975 [Phlebiopsis gigantea 11061_1 CR5-6]|uniref:Essential protein Yae1 N-terminal domain-containing protein n=1 Tax=Phlebiopsis gigantea (strain 11061_1 CR5-6) TaxID=745531 RepID=A0A0C3PNP1_PHLG1|nr:hypothetical protein PHLGIDRAFT_126975 [Phlebiopsis gigantea 11061_1 CR5-6]
MSRTAELSALSPLSGHLDLEASSILDPLYELKEATNTPTPLSGMLQDPNILRALMSPRKARRGSASSQRSGSQRSASNERSERGKEPRRTRKESDASSVLTLVLAEEERQVNHLKAVLRATGDRLDAETRRANQAEDRARAAESRAREAISRAAAAEAARHQTELEAARVKEETTRYRMLAEAAEREVRRAEADMQRLERFKAEAEQSAADARDVARKAQQVVREWQAREEGRVEGMRIEARRRYQTGREDGYEDGRSEGYEAGRAEGLEEGKEEGYYLGKNEGLDSGRLAGFEEGKQVGIKEGWKKGYEEGRRDEHKHALEAFDKFMDGEMDRESFISDEPDRVHQWVEATRHGPSPDVNESMSPAPRYIRPSSPVQQPRSTPPVPIYQSQPFVEGI